VTARREWARVSDGMTFRACEICGGCEWTDAYRGPVRDGVFGAYRDDGLVGRCGGCGVLRLAETLCTPASFYETSEYRERLREGLGSADYFANHDELQVHTLRAIWPQSLRAATVADIGCGAGALLDHLRGWSRRQVAVEPCDLYTTDLAARGYHVYPYAADAAGEWAGRVDVAFSIHVIEHTEHPRLFLEQIRPLLRPGGRLVISTPNHRDILLDLLPDSFPSFFYRVVHRWYFDAESLGACARLAGFEVSEIRHVHRYGMANALRWLRDRRPTGNVRLEGIQPMADGWWTAYLEGIGRSDSVYAMLTPAT
jgi:SAM-dependent methyltransferase